MALVSRCETIARDRFEFVEDTAPAPGKAGITSPPLDAVQVSGCLLEERLLACPLLRPFPRFLIPGRLRAREANEAIARSPRGLE